MIWRIVQTLVWLVGIAIFLLLIFVPSIGLHAFWNVLIPVAPALVVFAPGLWRNVCPLASTALFPRHMNWSLRKRLPDSWRHRLNLLAILLLLAIVPLRHVLLDTSGPATAVAIATLAVLAVTLGFIFEWKSAWCSGLCPVHPVEKLYGAKPAIALKNAHCHSCEQCVSICPDSTSGRHLVGQTPILPRRLGEYLMVGGFPGFIWGWSQVPDYTAPEGWANLSSIYAAPFLGLVITMLAYAGLNKLCAESPKSKHLLIDVFAASAVSCYYWFRLPALFGYAPNPGDGMLINLQGILPEFSIIVSRIVTTCLFFWWLVARQRGPAKWSIRPPLRSERHSAL
jgi:ferredoxin